MQDFESVSLPETVDVIAPDGSEIRFLPALKGGSMVHCKLHLGEVTKAVSHKTVEEIWYILGGRGELWRKQGSREEIAALLPGTAHTIPQGVAFQFRADPTEGLQFIIVTMPPWPNMEEAVPVPDHWPRAQASNN